MKRNNKALLIVLIMIMCFTSLFLVACGKKYTVTLSSNGATTQEEVAEGATYTLQTPTLDNHEFAGWYLSADFSGEAVTEIVVSADVTVYAKWERLYNVVLDTDGGTLATTKVQLKNGENVYNAVKDLAPTKTDAKFDAWMNGNNAISSSLVIEGADVTLTARYKYAYRVEIYQQNMAGDAYEKADEVVGYEYAGVTLAPELANMDGFNAIDHENAVTSKAISKNASENVFKLYYDRKTITVVFQCDYPDGTYAESVEYTVIYGNSITVPTDLVFEGYYLYGWENINGSVLYKTNSIDALVDSTATANPETFVPTDSVTLYPVWKAGYVNMFGGEDRILLLEDDAEVCYLVRGGIYFVGNYYPEDGSFEFEISDYTKLQGQISKEYESFFFFEDSRMESAYLLTGNSLNVNIILAFDSGNGVSYKETNPETGATKVSEGTYEIVDGEYVITFTTGDLAGQTKNTRIATVNTNIGAAKVFIFRNDEEYKYGQLVRFVMQEDGLTYYTGAYFLTLDGYGNAVYNDGETETALTYVRNGDGTYTLKVATTGQSAGVAKIFEATVFNQTVMGYMFYNQSVNVTFRGADGSELYMDGFYTATYTDANGNKTEASYVLEETRLLTVARLYGSTTRSFSLTIKQEFGEIFHTCEELLPTYAEHLYMGSGTLYYAPLIVLDYTAKGSADIYGYTTDGEYVKVSSGTYSYDEATGLYTYVETTAYEYTAAILDENGDLVKAGVLVTPVDYSNVKSIVFSVEPSIYTYSAWCWYSYTTKSDAPVNNTVTYTYTNEDQTHTLFVVNEALVIYTNSQGSFNGFIYQVYDEEEMIYCLAIEVNGQYGLMYVKFYEDGTFYIYDKVPFVAYEFLANGVVGQTSTLIFDGMGTWTYVELTEGGEEVTYIGTAVDTGKYSQASGASIMKFTGTNADNGTIEFEFIQLTASNQQFFARYNQEINGTFTQKDGEGTLILDGFSFRAEYIASAIAQTELCGYVINDGAIVLTLSDGTKVTLDIDLTNKTYTIRGAEAGSYLIIDNQTFVDYLITLDGYGKVVVRKQVYNEETEEYEMVDVDTNATYEKVGDRYVISFTEGARVVTYEGTFGIYTMSGTAYRAFVVYHTELNLKLVNPEDWSVILVDAYGSASRILANGTQEAGACIIISSNLMYYYSADGEYACIYTYDADKGTATPSSFSKRGYYSENLDSLLFTEYGFAIFGGTERLYYNVADGKVSIYRYDPTDANANEYGFVAEEFGRFAQEITYQDTKYYQTSGYDLTFARENEGREKYPVTIKRKKYSLDTLSFIPGGAREFAVSGVVTVAGENFSCIVGCEYNDATQEYETYIKLGTMRFVVDINFKGEDNSSYSIKAMYLDVTSYSAKYMYYNLIYQMFFGTTYPDQYGTISLSGTYNEEGELQESSLTTNFKETSGILNREGKLMNLTNVQFTTTRDGAYIVEFDGEDGYTYRMQFSLAQSQYFANTYEYSLSYVARLQEFEVEGYKLTVGRLIADSVASGERTPGQVVYAKVVKGDKIYDINSIMGDLTSARLVYREYDDNGKITFTTYFAVSFEEAEEVATVKLFTSCTIKEEAVETIYTANGLHFVDVVVETHQIYLFGFTQYNEDGEPVFGIYSAANSVYDEANDLYLFESGSTPVFAAIVEGKNGAKTAIIDIAVVVKAGENTLYFAYNNNYNSYLVFVRYNGNYYRPDADNAGYDELAKIYAFTSQEKSFIIVVNTNADGTTSYVIREVRYLYAEDGINYVAIDVNTNEVVVLRFQNRNQVATSSTYDEATNTYTVVTGTATFTVKVEGENIVITKQ